MTYKYYMYEKHVKKNMSSIFLHFFHGADSE